MGTAHHLPHSTQTCTHTHTIHTLIRKLYNPQRAALLKPRLLYTVGTSQLHTPQLSPLLQAVSGLSTVSTRSRGSSILLSPQKSRERGRGLPVDNIRHCKRSAPAGSRTKNKARTQPRASWPKMWIMGKWTCPFLSVVWTAELAEKALIM